MGIGLGTPGQVFHFAGIAGGEPLVKSVEALRPHCRARSHRLEPQPSGLGFQLAGKGCPMAHGASRSSARQSEIVWLAVFPTQCNAGQFR